MPIPLLLTLLTAALLVGCSEDGAPAADMARPNAPAERPDTVTDTIRIEGMPEPMRLRLFRAEDLPLPFSLYVPADMAASTEDEGESGTVHIEAAFGDVPDQDAFIHVRIYADSVNRQQAEARVRAFKTGRGIPVSQGIELIADEVAEVRMPWAELAYGFRYQSHGTWFAGSIGVGRHAGRFFHIIRHYPVEYGDGFEPRADLIIKSWRWEDGTPLSPTDAP